MADKTKKITDAETRVILDWFKAKGVNWKPCPACNQPQMLIAEWRVSTPIIKAKGGLQLGGITYPHVMTICANCGHERLFNAVLIGISPGVEEDG